MTRHGRRDPSKSQRERIFARDGHRCTYTNHARERCVMTELLTIEHILPRSDGGTNADDNLTSHCWFHNQKRNTEYAHMRRTPFRRSRKPVTAPIGDALREEDRVAQMSKDERRRESYTRLRPELKDLLEPRSTL